MSKEAMGRGKAKGGSKGSGSKYMKPWEHMKKDGRTEARLSFDEIAEILGFPIDHSFLNYKKELLTYGYQVGKISLREKHVTFHKLDP